MVRIDSLNIAHWNANGVRNKKVELELFLQEKDIHIISINETRLTSKQKFYVHNYDIIRKDRDSDSPSGGVMLLVKKGIDQYQITTKTKQLECVGIKLKNNVVIISAYLSPNSKFDPNEFNSLLNLGNSVLILGDLNCKHRDWNCMGCNTNGSLLNKYVQKHNINLIYPEKHTHIPSNNNLNPSTIDIALFKNINKGSSIDVIEELSSDHYPIIITFNNLPINTVEDSPKLNSKKTDWIKFRELIEDNLILKTKFQNNNEVDHCINQLSTIISQAYKNSTPTVKIRSPEQLPSHIKQKIKIKNALRRKYQKTGNPALRTLQNKYTNLIKKEISDWTDQQWSNKLEKLKTGDNTIWRMTKSLTKSKKCKIPPLTKNNITATSDKEKADLISEQFFETHLLTRNMSTKSHEKEIINKKNNFLRRKINLKNVKLTSPKEIKKVTKKLKNNKAPGHDAITNKMIKNLSKKAFVQLTYIYNYAFNNSYFPIEWKKAVVLAFPKPGKDHTLPSSYRPISLLTGFSKILEILILNRLKNTKLLDLHLKNHQFGFRERRSTIKQLMRVVNDITHEFNKNRDTLMVLLDIEKAFDTVWHDGLLVKLAEMGTPSYLVNLAANYLSEREFTVKINSSESQSRAVPAGVPQGSILGPIFFLIYINDMPGYTGTNLAQFADDTAVYTSSWDVVKAAERVSKHCTQLQKYFHKWKVKINEAKTEALIFTKKKHSKTKIKDIKLFENNIHLADDARYLGVYLDTRLNFNTHSKKTLQKSQIQFSQLYPLLCKKSKINIKLKLLLYKMLIRPVFAYATPMWNNISNRKNIKKLQIFQNKCLRVIQAKPPWTKTSFLHKKSNIQYVEDYLSDLTKSFLESLSVEDQELLHVHKDTPFRIKHKLAYK